MTAVANSVFTAAQFNTFVRDNLNETAPAKSTTTSSHFVGNGVNSIVERISDETSVSAAETTTSTSYTDLATAGPTVTVTTGTTAIVFFRAGMENSGANAGSFMAFEISGATAGAAADVSSINIAGLAAASRARIGTAYMLNSLTAGVNTFTAKYKVSANTGTFTQRQLAVMPF